MSRIDSHQHFWRFDPQRDTWISDEMQVLRRDFLPSDLAPYLEENQIEGTVAVQADESEAETEWLLALAEEHPFIRGVVGWVDLKTPDLENRLLHFASAQKLKGFRTITQGKPAEQYFANKEFWAGVKQLHPLGYTYDLLLYHQQFPEAIRFTERFPEQAFMLDHLGKPPIATGSIRAWKEHMRILSAHPNTYCKLSGMVTEADWANWRYEDLLPYLDIAGEYFGTDRLCFGSDWPVCLLAGSYAQVSDILHRFVEQLRPAERKAIWGDNALRFYRMADDGWRMADDG